MTTAEEIRRQYNEELFDAKMYAALDSIADIEKCFDDEYRCLPEVAKEIIESLEDAVDSLAAKLSPKKLTQSEKEVNMKLSDILEGAGKLLNDAEEAYIDNDIDGCRRNLIWLRKFIEDNVTEEAKPAESQPAKPKQPAPAADV